MAAEAAAYALAAVSQAPEPFRRMLSDMFGRRPGICTSTSWAVTQSGSPAMNCVVAAGTGLVLGSESALQGLYFCQSTSTTTVTIGAADATNPRRDLIVARIRDNQYATGPTSAFSLEAVAGTPAASPADPTVPANCLVIARIQVNASPDTTIVTGDITDLRTSYTGQTRAAGLGGTIVCTSTTRPTISLTEGVVIYETDTDILYVYNGATWSSLAAVPTTWAAVSFASTWANVGAAQAAQYRRIGDVVYVRGMVVRSSGVLQPIFTLPTGFRPPVVLTFTERWYNGSADALGLIQIAADGVVSVIAAAATGTVTQLTVDAIFSTTT